LGPARKNALMLEVFWFFFSKKNRLLDRPGYDAFSKGRKRFFLKKEAKTFIHCTQAKE
jgi:hypothetical protein